MSEARHDPDNPLVQRIADLGPWFHNLRLPSGVETAPGHFLGDYPQSKFESFAHVLPDDLEGCSVLDIGCNNGTDTLAWLERGYCVLAVDANPLMVAETATKGERFGARLRVLTARAVLAGLLGTAPPGGLRVGTVAHEAEDLTPSSARCPNRLLRSPHCRARSSRASSATAAPPPPP